VLTSTEPDCNEGGLVDSLLYITQAATFVYLFHGQDAENPRGCTEVVAPQRIFRSAAAYCRDVDAHHNIESAYLLPQSDQRYYGTQTPRICCRDISRPTFHREIYRLYCAVMSSSATPSRTKPRPDTNKLLRRASSPKAARIGIPTLHQASRINMSVAAGRDGNRFVADATGNDVRSMLFVLPCVKEIAHAY